MITPIFAEIADKMPPIGSVWMIGLIMGLIAATLTVCLSRVRLWLGGMVILAAFAIGVLAAWPNRMDEHILKELGAGYLMQQRIAAFAPCMIAIGMWLIVCLRRLGNRTVEQRSSNSGALG